VLPELKQTGPKKKKKKKGEEEEEVFYGVEYVYHLVYGTE
jgi:hypothetical protein